MNKLSPMLAVRFGSSFQNELIIRPKLSCFSSMPRRAAPIANHPPDASSMVISAGRSEEQVAFESAVVDFFVEAADLLGVPKSVAAIYGIVFATPEPLSFADVESKLALSRGSISQGLRVLREIGALKTIVRDKDRREFFAPDMELRRLVQHFIEHRLQIQLEDGEKRLSRVTQRLPLANPGHADLLRKRLDYLTGWHAKARALLPLIRTSLILSG